MLRQNDHTLLNGEYEVFDGEASVGKAIVDQGTITTLAVQSGIDEDFRGQILFKLMLHICLEANQHNSNLSIMVPPMKTQRLKRFLEQFRFRETHTNIFKRTAGASVPPSVIY